MGRIRSLGAQSPAIAISVLALALSVGGGAYAATHSGHSRPAGQSQAAAANAAGHAQAGRSAITSGLPWTSLSLTNGWVSENAAFATGNPKVALQNNIVYLSGSLAQPTPGSSIFATLPASFRPSHNLYIAVYTDGDTVGTLFIGSNGTMEAYAPNSCGSGNTATCFTSLATVSFPINS